MTNKTRFNVVAAVLVLLLAGVSGLRAVFRRSDLQSEVPDVPWRKRDGRFRRRQKSMKVKPVTDPDVKKHD